MCRERSAQLAAALSLTHPAAARGETCGDRTKAFAWPLARASLRPEALASFAFESFSKACLQVNIWQAEGVSNDREAQRVLLQAKRARLARPPSICPLQLTRQCSPPKQEALPCSNLSLRASDFTQVAQASSAITRFLGGPQRRAAQEEAGKQLAEDAGGAQCGAAETAQALDEGPSGAIAAPASAPVEAAAAESGGDSATPAGPAPAQGTLDDDDVDLALVDRRVQEALWKEAALLRARKRAAPEDTAPTVVPGKKASRAREQPARSIATYFSAHKRP